MRAYVRRRPLQLAAFIFLALVFLSVAYVGDTSRQSLCAQRADLEARIAVTEEVLAEHPTGPIFGIPRKFIEDGQERNRVTRENLSGLICSWSEIWG